MSARVKAIVFLILGSFFIFTPPVLAAFSFKIESVKPDSVSSKNQEVEVLLTITDLPSASYLRVAWQKEEGSSYFGYVKDNEGHWVKIKSLSGDCSDYYHISDIATNSATLITKIGEEEELASGTYVLRAHRFTSTCKSYKASENTFEIDVNLPAPPSPTPSPSPSPSPSPTLTSSPFSSSTPSPSPSPRGVEISETLSGEILGEEGSPGGIYLLESPSPSPEVLGEKTNKSRVLAKILLIAGLIFLFTAACWLWYTRLKEGRLVNQSEQKVKIID